MEHEGRCMGNAVNVYMSDMDFYDGTKPENLTGLQKTIYFSDARKKLRLVLENFKPDFRYINNFNYWLTASIILKI